MSYLDEAAQDMAESFKRIFITAFGHGYDFGCESKEGECKHLKAENATLREQMERLVTLLRVDCDIDASWDGLRRFWSIELTEGGCLMRDRACKAEAENAKLREEIEAAKHDLQVFSMGSVQLEAENAKLRELVDYMTPIALYGASEQERDRMRELGVEE